MQPTEENLILLTLESFAVAVVAAMISLAARKLRGMPRTGLVVLAILLIFLALLPMTRTLWWQLSRAPGLEKDWPRSPSFYVTIAALLAGLAIWFLSQPARSVRVRSLTVAILLLLAAATVGASEKLIKRAYHDRTVVLQTGLQSAVGQFAPDFTFYDTGGHHHTLSEFRGKVVLLNFWSTTCGPCVHEMPDLSALQDRFNDRGFALLLVSPDDPMPLRRFFAEHPTQGTKGYLAPAAHAPDFYHAYEAWPITFLIDRSGRVLDSWIGAASPDFLQRHIEQSL